MTQAAKEAPPRLKKPAGWRGKKDDPFWYKTTSSHLYSMCSTCGHETLGYANNLDRTCHHDSCPRMAGPRKEWTGYVDASGRARVRRLTLESDYCHETREEALLALDAELAAQADAIAQQRAQVAAMLREETPAS